LDSAAEPQPLDLRKYARIFWRRKWIFLAVLVIVPVAVYFVSASSAKVYQSSVLIELQPTSVDSAQGAAQGGPSAQFIAIAARLIETTGVAQAAAQQLSGPRASPSALLDAINVSTDPNTGFITISGRAGSPARAADIANAFGAAINSIRAQQAVGQLSESISGLQAQINALPANAIGPRNQLITQMERLRAERAAQGANAQVIEPATPSSSPVSPHPRRNALLGLLVAALLGLGLVAIVESLDRRVRRAEDVEELLGLPLLSSVPRSAFNGTFDRPKTIEAFRSLRANLTFFNVDRDVRSIAVASGHKGEGKTLVTLGLSRAYAHAGSDVVLVDADLRRPTVASRTGLAAEPGLSDVLTGKAELVDALYEDESTSRFSGSLRVLPAGEVPPNPAELLASQRMHRLIEELSTLCDIVLIDTSPLLAVSDALPLIESVSGTLLVARVGVVRRDELQRLGRILAAARSHPLGTVITGLTERESNTYSYSAYVQPAEPLAASNGTGAKPARGLAMLGRRRG
jgi:capsular exopolysaccharide synthesis family protein